MIRSPLAVTTLFSIGPVPITAPVVITWAIMAFLAIGGFIATRNLDTDPSRRQAALELVAITVADHIRDVMRIAPGPYVSLIGTLFVFILTANWSSLIPGIEPPTAHIETDAALASIVFVAVIYFGVRERGLSGYLKSFARPTIFMVPINLIETFTRTFSLIVRLFGNVLSGIFLIGIVLSLAGLIVPIPLMALELLTGAIQAYIFTVLAMVFIGSAVAGGGDAEPDERKKP